MKVLITGITGTVGGFLARDVLAQDAATEIYGTYRWRSRMQNVEGLSDRVQLHECDVRDGSSVRKLVSEVRPDQVYHLAAQSNVITSRHAPADTLSTNIVGLVNLLDAVREIHAVARVLVPGSSEEYGLQYEHELPIVETNTMRPLSPYAVSKVAQDMTAYQYASSYKLHLVRTRAFNHTGPGREDVFVESNFAHQVADIEAGLRPARILVGNLDVVRDYSDARDIVRAYILAMEKAVPGEPYNICSGKGVRIREILDMLLEMAGVQAEIVVEVERVRDKEPPVLIGNCDKFHQATGWVPQIPLRQTMQDILDFWRSRVRSNAETAKK